jgi:hypothetical protein
MFKKKQGAQPNNKNRLGKLPWNKGKKGVQRVSLETRRKLSLAGRGNQNAKGTIHSLAFRKRLSILKRGNNAWNWKGGISRRKHCNIRARQWRSNIFQRDNWTCQTCGARSQEGKKIFLEAHHIKSWAEYPKLRYVMDNGITLCVECHKLTDNYKGKNNGISKDNSDQENPETNQEN